MRRPIPIALRDEAPLLSLDARLEALAAPLRTLDEAGVRAAFALAADDAPIKTTLSLCPACLAHVPAAFWFFANSWASSCCKDSRGRWSRYTSTWCAACPG